MAICKVIASISRSGKRKSDFWQIRLETSVIPLYRVILTEKSFSDTILVILDDPLGQKVNLKDKYNFNICDVTPRNQAECAERDVPRIQRVD